MVDGNMAQIGDRELLKLFVINSTPTFTRRAKQVFAELERRGYLFDTERKEFVSCEEWNKRYIRSIAIDCEEQMARRDRLSQK